MRLFSYIIPLLAAGSLTLPACATSSDDAPHYGSPEAGTPSDSSLTDSDAAPSDATFIDGAFSDSQPVGKYVLYAHNNNILYSVDPYDSTLPVTQLGTFDCLGTTGQDDSMTDIAVDKDGRLYGVSETAVYLDMKVSGSTVQCQQGKKAIDSGTLGTAAKFFGLTFAPATPALAPTETLIGANSNGDLYAIDTATGALTLVGNFGTVPLKDIQNHSYPQENVGQNWELSGDIVFMENNGDPVGFATLRDCPHPPASTDCSKIDTLVEIDVLKLKPTQAGGTPPIVTKSVRGQVIQTTGCTGDACLFGSIYGIAALEKKVYGFSREGMVLSIDNTTGEGVLVSTPLPSYLNGFAGAGVTTVAPVIAPPK